MTTTNLGMPTRVRLTPAPPEGALIDSPPFPQAAIRELGKDTQRANLRHATHTIRTKRQRVVAELDHWQDLRSAGEAVKNRVARHLDTWLVQLEENLTRAGSTVHWARDAEEANRIIIDLIRATGSDEVVKVKSMATQEIDLNEALEGAGIAAWETDLAELIVQLGHDRPSHILVPAIHRNRTEVRDIFLEEMGRYGTPPPEGLDDDPGRLANAARTHLRDKFLRARVAVSGANFAVAETGSLVVVESEGNGRMCLTLPQTLISVVGIEKVVPTFADLEVFLQLLPRSSTAERMNPYTTIWTGPTPGDGTQDVHVVLVDNGRTRALADPSGRAALRCIRCSACLNICPVFEKVGGHAYGSVYPGPIGAILNPQLRGVESAVDRSLPFASTLCGACDDVCPVKIPISDILVQQRHRIVEAKKAEAGRKPHLESVLMKGGGWLMGDARRLALMQRAANVFGLVGGRAIGHIGNWPVPGLSRWLRARNVPMPPTASFRAQFDKTSDKTRGGQR
ncbi:iron-sulfur cluster-binding protein [Propioniciclava sinopodophylli]|uniref:Iron-sulfur cluster-binding protein n=1 Tax=Propioniciclava sinopodophylli TaxID=1837344 RepID=A0A4Q9KF51_9ACTN|nr:LutB/LldF family L-lactate oxidation iron-sulfur protein [Propioniciclava sinopodophylli]TBT86535.1 iron-sulfur cluster-binding protein [Propioniciclava sinopodophylli]